MADDQWMPSQFPNRWAWILDVLFGGILVIAFEELEHNLSSAWTESLRAVSAQAISAFSLSVFFLYDVLVYHFLIHTYPYRISALSAARALLDVLMAFCLMKVLLPGVRPHPETHMVAILLGLTLWHLSAAAWHLLANWDHFRKMPPAFAVAPHFVFVGLYWIVLALCYSATQTLQCSRDTRELFMIAGLCASVFGVSLYRSRQLLEHLRGLNAPPIRQAVLPSNA